MRERWASQSSIAAAFPPNFQKTYSIVLAERCSSMARSPTPRIPRGIIEETSMNQDPKQGQQNQGGKQGGGGQQGGGQKPGQQDQTKPGQGGQGGQQGGQSGQQGQK